VKSPTGNSNLQTQERLCCARVYYLITSRHNTERQTNALLLSIDQFRGYAQRSTTLNTVESCYQHVPHFSPVVPFQMPPFLKMVLQLIRDTLNTRYQWKKFAHKPPEPTHVLYNQFFNQIHVVMGL